MTAVFDLDGTLLPSMAKAYNAAKQEVDAAMRFVNQILAAAVNGEDPDTVTEESCGGDCASCGGCH